MGVKENVNDLNTFYTVFSEYCYECAYIDVLYVYFDSQQGAMLGHWQSERTNQCKGVSQMIVTTRLILFATFQFGEPGHPL